MCSMVRAVCFSHVSDALSPPPQPGVSPPSASRQVIAHAEEQPSSRTVGCDVGVCLCVSLCTVRLFTSLSESRSSIESSVSLEHATSERATMQSRAPADWSDSFVILLLLLLLSSQNSPPPSASSKTLGQKEAAAIAPKPARDDWISSSSPSRCTVRYEWWPLGAAGEPRLRGGDLLVGALLYSRMWPLRLRRRSTSICDRWVCLERQEGRDVSLRPGNKNDSEGSTIGRQESRSECRASGFSENVFEFIPIDPVNWKNSKHFSLRICAKFRNLRLFISLATLHVGWCLIVQLCSSLCWKKI